MQLSNVADAGEAASLTNLWQWLDWLQTSEDIVREEGLESLFLNATTVCNLRTITDYIAHRRYGFPRDTTLDEFHFVMVDPKSIQLDFRSMPLPLLGEHAVIGCGGGNWDRSTIRFDEKSVVKAIRERFIEGISWSETSQYRLAITRADRGLPAWNDCRTREDIDRRCDYLDDLFASILEHGYKSQQELFEEAHSDDFTPFVHRVDNYILPDELRLAISRDGELIRIAHGRHRLAIAQILDIDQIPAIVQIIHRDLGQSPEELPGVIPIDSDAYGDLVWRLDSLEHDSN